MYPHWPIANLSAKNRSTLWGIAAILPAYSCMPALLALLGWVATAAATKPIDADGVSRQRADR